MKGARSLFLAIAVVGTLQLSCVETAQECLASSSHENECRNPDTVDPRLLDENLGSFVSVENEDGGLRRTEQFTIGPPQEMLEEFEDSTEFVEKFLKVIEETMKYMEKTYMMTYEEYVLPFPAVCQNYHARCSAWAALGACDGDLEEDEVENLKYEDDEDSYEPTKESMMTSCAPACQVCDQLLPILKDCTPDTDENIFGPGDLNTMFERIVGEKPYEDGVVIPGFTPRVISRPSHPSVDESDRKEDCFLGPWIVTLEDFLTDEECDRFIALGLNQEFERSGMQSEEDADGEQAWRSSTNAWCYDECSEDPVAKRVIEKINNTTGIPGDNSEELQLVKYAPGQYYKEHHDFSYETVGEYSGPRIVTFFLYLNDVDEGGATQFSDITLGSANADSMNGKGPISIDVIPKKGTALVWPNVLDDDLDEMDDRTYHAALPVIKGEKYGANAWFHLRSFSKDDPCDHDALDELRYWIETEEDSE